MNFFDDLLDTGLNLGTKYLENEISEHGNQAPAVRPDTNQVPSGTEVKTTAEITKENGILIGVGVLVVTLFVIVIAKVSK